MPAPASASELLELVEKCGLVEGTRLAPFKKNPTALSSDTKRIAATLVQGGVLTAFQAKCLLSGRYKGLVLGSYKILDLIGQGGMGTVYLAEHVGLNRKVAVKVLANGQADELAMQRFYREAKSAAALDHPNIVRVYDISQTGATHYIVMEYVEGETLRALVSRTGPLHYAQAADYIAQAAAGLQQAHERGLVHRDIKPDNLILDKSGTVKILDMGLARVTMSDDGSLTQKFEPNAILGTPDFLAPEQAINGNDVDIRADIYGLGATFFALVSGKPPFSGTTAQKLTQHQIVDAPSLSKLKPNTPKQLSEIVSRMMAKRPEDRFRTPADVIDALTPWLFSNSQNLESRPGIAAGLPAALSKKMTQSRLAPAAPEGRAARPLWHWAAAGGTLTVLLIGGLTWAFSGGSSDAKAANSGTPPVAAFPAPAAASPEQAPATPAAPPRTVFTLDLSGVEPFKLPMRLRNATDIDAPGKLPDGWRADSLRSGFATELEVEATDGGKVVSLRNIDPGSRSQFFSGKQLVMTRPRNVYTVVIEYRTEGGSYGTLECRAGVPGTMPTQKFSMYDTAGEWRTGEYELNTVRNDTPLFVFIHNMGNGGENQLSVRAVSVVERSQP